jgi:hypothetical protein
MVHEWIVNGLANIGTPLLERVLRQKKVNEKYVFNFDAIMAHLDKKGCKESVIRQMQMELLEEAFKDPLLEEFRSSDDSRITFDRDNFGLCIVKEDGRPILRCSSDSWLGRLGLAYYHLELMKSEGRKAKKEYGNVA